MLLEKGADSVLITSGGLQVDYVRDQVFVPRLAD
jgi:hypothetical protein